MILSFTSCSSPTNKYIVAPKTKVGEITRTSSEADLIKIYGKENLKRTSIPLGEGMEIEGTILFPHTNKELTIQWKDNFSQPNIITISTNQTVWKTSSGITIGTTLNEVEKINEDTFKLTGFEWDYPGRTVSWEKGALSTALQIDFESDVSLPWKEYEQVMGSDSFSSDNQIMRKLNLKVTHIHIRWDIDRNNDVCDKNRHRYTNAQEAIKAGVDESEFGATFCPEYKMHPSWDSDKDGINDCYENSSCSEKIDYMSPK